MSKNTKYSDDERRKLMFGAYRSDINGWIRVHVQGEPFQIGFQHGYLLYREIEYAAESLKTFFEKEYKLKWDFFRRIAEEYYWPKVPDEQREEMKGIVEGAKVRGGKIDLLDVLALNGYGDTITYYMWKEYQKNSNSPPSAPGHCSAFIATGDATKNGEIVVAHNMWWNYMLGSIFNVLISIYPSKGRRMFIESWPGSIGGNTIDWDMNDAGIIVSETTITSAVTFNPEGTPYFVRARKAIQYAENLDQWLKIMLEDNNGGFACDWLVGDAKTGEIMWLELGTYHHAVKRTKNGFFVGSNVALDPKVREETTFDYEIKDASHTARYTRLMQLMEENKGSIDLELGKKIIADHFDVSYRKVVPSRNTLCGHIENDPRGWPEWGCGPYYPFGTTDGKVVNSSLILEGSMWAHWGKPCDENFIADEFFRAHPEYEWQKEYTRDIIAYPWTLFSVHPKWTES